MDGAQLDHALPETDVHNKSRQDPWEQFDGLGLAYVEQMGLLQVGISSDDDRSHGTCQQGPRGCVGQNAPFLELTGLEGRDRLQQLAFVEGGAWIRRPQDVANRPVLVDQNGG
jgi:hypothetical protein